MVLVVLEQRQEVLRYLLDQLAVTLLSLPSLLRVAGVGVRTTEPVVRGVLVEVLVQAEDLEGLETHLLHLRLKEVMVAQVAQISVIMLVVAVVALLKSGLLEFLLLLLEWRGKVVTALHHLFLVPLQLMLVVAVGLHTTIALVLLEALVVVVLVEEIVQTQLLEP